MPRYYNNIVKPSTNKAVIPGQEQKGGKTPSENPPRDQNKKDETGGQ